MKYVAALLGLLPCICLAQFPYPPDMPGAQVETYRTVGEVELSAWIFEPDGQSAAQPRPAVVFFYGGGFRFGSPAQFENQARHFASRGMVAIAPDYRVFDRHGATIGDAIGDAKAAIRWVRRNADRLGIDPNRIAAAGGSAGGTLAAATAVLPGFDDIDADSDAESTPNALALYNPAVIMAPVASRPDIQPLGNADELRGEADRESLSPLHHVRSGIPPTIIFHGTADTRAPYSHSELYTELMQEFGNQCELVGYDGADHGFFNFGRGDGFAYADTLSRTDSFFVSLGWLSSE